MVRPIALLAVLTLIAAPAPARANGTLAGMYYCDAREAGIDHDKALTWAVNKATPPLYPGNDLDDLTAAIKEFTDPSNLITAKVQANRMLLYLARNCPQFVK